MTLVVPMPALAELERAPLETERLLLVPLTLSLAHEMFDAVDSSREHINRWQNFSHWRQLEHARRAIEVSLTQWQSGTDARFAMVRRSDGRFLGGVGIEDAKGAHRCANLAYWIRADAANQGYTTEAARTVVRWGFERVGLHRMQAVIATGNTPSVRVAVRLGFRREGTMRAAERVGECWYDAFLFGLLRQEARP